MKLLEVKGLTKFYHKRAVVKDASFEVSRGEIVGLLGPNGAGKTTAFRMTMGIIPVNSGKIHFDGHDVSHLPMYKRARMGMGYLSQEPSVFQKLTVEENVEAILEMMNLSRRERRRRTWELLEELDLAKLAKNRAFTLSGGEKRRLEITRALVSSPSLILLDEPFSGVDPIAVFDIQQIMVNLRERGIGILLTDHSVRETLSITDRSYIIIAGEILTSGSSRELVNDPLVRKIYLGEQFQLEGIPAAPRPEEQAVRAAASSRERPEEETLEFERSQFDEEFQRGLREYDVEEIERELDRRNHDVDSPP